MKQRTPARERPKESDSRKTKVFRLSHNNLEPSAKRAPVLMLCKKDKLFRQLISQRLVYYHLYNNQINARALIGQSAVGYCAGRFYNTVFFSFSELVVTIK